MNNKMYRKLYTIYNKLDVNGYRVENPRSVHDIRRRAMVLKGSTTLTKGEEAACTQIWIELKDY